MNRTSYIAFASILVGCAVLGLKMLAFWLTGSVALYSDALESVVNVATAIATAAAVRYSALPPDSNHPYGHHKAEYFAAVLIGVLIILAAASILHEAYYAFHSPRQIEAPAQGLVVNGIAGVINLIWAQILIRYGRKHRSPSMAADGRHLMTDVLSSAGVIIGIALAIATGWQQLDAVLAALVALNILWSGWQVMRESVAGLMDVAVPPELLDQIRGIIAAEANGAIEAHDVRTRIAGSATFVDFHLVVPGDMTVTCAHDICDRVEQALKREVPGSTISIHVEPENKAKHAGIVVV
ncbi:cadmium transporter [Agaricicola taiwanensis]|uniref:Protein p34 n=1 Tax=Agaricicola taiwanensis TaxID=591372 RepID=A0A8J3DUX2_9RHOB|nr:cation diffusion facilitator family transporter [Agaricicola taiwanensis]GGE43685.1 cadmium transporter [Agaricicola taiwanensis]